MARVACPRCRTRFEVGPERSVLCPSCGSPLRRDRKKLDERIFLGRYRLDARISAGAQGEVYRGVHIELDKPVAVKILSADFAADRACAARFAREARLAAGIVHPNVVRVIDVGETDGTHFLVMDLVEGRDLAALLEEKGFLPVDRAIALAIEAGRGLAAVHERGIIHRDVKPRNLVLDRVEDRVVLTDFGMAKNPGADDGLTLEGSLLGTPATMAPETCRGEETTEASDQYALGVTLFYLLAGSMPYEDKTALGVLHQHLSSPIPDVRDRRPDCPPGVAAIVRRTMAKDPAERFESVAALVDALGDPAAPPAESRAAARPDMVKVWLMGGCGTILSFFVLLCLGAAAGSAGKAKDPTRAFHAARGTVQGDGSLELEYDFASSDQVEDFHQAEDLEILSSGDGILELQGPGVLIHAGRFDDVTIEVVFRVAVRKPHVVGIGVVHEPHEGYMGQVGPSGQEILYLSGRTVRAERLAGCPVEKQPSVGDLLTMNFGRQGKSLTYRSSLAGPLSADDDRYPDGQPFVGIWKAPGPTRIESIRIRGRLLKAR